MSQPLTAPFSIQKTSLISQPEPLIRPFGFKGGAMTEIVQTAVRIESGQTAGYGMASQSPLWSDGAYFAALGENKTNQLMRDMTAFALDRLAGETVISPLLTTPNLFEEVLAFGRKQSGRDNLRPTFALNALVAVDNALWQIWFAESKAASFDNLLPEECREALSYRHQRVAAIPLISYHTPLAEMDQMIQAGCFFMKIKIGQSGTQEEMLEKDKNRLAEIHALLKDKRTASTQNGLIPYYFDANGRYETKETLCRFIDFAEKIGALDRIALIEEPFDEQNRIDVSDLPVRLAADESAHTVADVRERIDLGYRAIALKPAAKTMSVSLLMAAEAHKRGIPCFCADLTVCPILIDWNKMVAARLQPFPGFDCGLLESNGHQNYARWNQMLTDLPQPQAAWVPVERGYWKTESGFFTQNAGIFDRPGKRILDLFD